MEQQQQQLQHFSHPKHPLVFNQDDGIGYSYSCKECGLWETVHHKSCAELPLGLHHPLHPIHPLILFSPRRWAPARAREYFGEDEQIYKCELCKEYKDVYAYRCSRCDFNLHIKCASLAPTMDAEFHHHPLTPVWKWITFTCDLCGKEDKASISVGPIQASISGTAETVLFALRESVMRRTSLHRIFKRQLLVI